MKNLLQINSSLFASGGQSSLLANSFVAAWQAAHPGAVVTARNLAADEVPHLTAERFQAFLAKPESRTPAQQQVVAYSDALIDEIKRADVIVLGLPMYNFGVPSQLKSYFDHVARAGVSFKYTDKGPVGLLTGKQAYVFATRGGLYAGTPADTETQYVRDFLRFIGITDVEFVYAEGLAINEASKLAGIDGAQSAIQRLFPADALAA